VTQGPIAGGTSLTLTGSGFIGAKLGILGANNPTTSLTVKQFHDDFPLPHQPARPAWSISPSRRLWERVRPVRLIISPISIRRLPSMTSL